MHVYRTHTCGALRLADAGKPARLSGWVHRRRDHGQLLFVDLRDHYGVTQTVIDVSSPLFKQADALKLESVVTVTGTVVKRSADTVNPKLPTGEIELQIAEIAVRSEAQPLPFPVNIDAEYPEEMRLKYRFLDLRREAIHRNIVLRSQVIASIRRRMIEQGFTEFQTPILTASSPEGARDYLVPSRLHPGKFYALPQAPQQFKQLLMVAGFDRYFQIAPCFRDEAGRADRSPGEFYQLDFEMSYVTQEDVFAAIEPVLHGVFEEFAGGRRPERTDALPAALGLGDGDAVFFSAGVPGAFSPFASAARLKIGEELALTAKDCFEFCWITDFPMYERDEETGQIAFSHNPFSMPRGGLAALEQQDPLEITAYQYDIVCNGG